ncbi:histidine phosphatase family protein [Paenibacillus barengoltzii]|jgi:alpha-ribazole phosphatase|uniref:Alpha-ribazole phosphatase n=1 Tax=Paenibacillus barengoltzii G22 TaxID=1235795 RepID=R9LA76_9BACL|nr:histidine phosphatase family protein [Paenibacillus barengoltzii]EOS55483.1 hypothetical protein C812_02610 [Paenibacillus barengoltzii G22]
MDVEWWLVRHGLTAWNTERRYQGHSDPPLLPGETSGLTGLRRELEGVNFAAVYASDLRRCLETLAWARPDLRDKVHIDPRLREMNFGQWEGQTYEMLKDDERYRAWIDNPQAVTPPGGESWQAFQSRLSGVCGDLLARSGAVKETVSGVLGRVSDQPAEPLAPKVTQQLSTSVQEPWRLLIVTHGGVISLLCSLLMPGLRFWDTRIGPGGVQRLYFQGKEDGEGGKGS